MNWRKSSHSSNNGGQCVECATHVGTVLIRDTTDRAGYTLRVTADAWVAFTSTIT